MAPLIPVAHRSNSGLQSPPGMPVRDDAPPPDSLRSPPAPPLGTAERAALQDQLAQCHDPLLLAEIISKLLGASVEKLSVQGPIRLLPGNRTSLGKNVYLSTGCEIHDHGPVYIGNHVVIGPNVVIRAEPGQPVHVGNRVWLGAGVHVAPGAHIQDDAIIGAGTTVTGLVPADTLLHPNPPQSGPEAH